MFCGIGKQNLPMIQCRIADLQIEGIRSAFQFGEIQRDLKGF